MRRFESEVQHIKYEVMKEVAKETINENINIGQYTIPKKIAAEFGSTTRCCIYKEIAILEERVQLAITPPDEEHPVIDVIDIACDQCPAKRFTITEACRGCLAHRCVQVCPKEAISIVNGRAYINQDKCIECGKCRAICPFNAIADVMRPCKKACGSKAIEISESKKAVINRDKCTSCGSCVYHCPFGAISERSQMVPIIKEIEAIKKNKEKNIYAIIAPAISSQFNVRIGQVVKAIKQLGFKDVIEAALGADIVVLNEGLEFAENVAKGDQDCLISSCCPAFVAHVEKNYPELMDRVSTMVSPMVAIARLIKEMDKNAVVVFMGPCTAKKVEASDHEVTEDVDYVMTFEELEAMIDAYGIVMEDCEDELLDNASYFGRIFARSGGLKDAVNQVIKEQELDVDFKPVVCDGIQECDKALKMLKVGRLNGNFIEGMACKGGCIGGAASITHGPKDKGQVDKYAKLAMEKTICDALRVIDLKGIELHRHR